MPKYKVGVYYNLPQGGAKRLMDGLIAHLPANYELFSLPTPPTPNNRIMRDLFNFVGSYFFAYKLRRAILHHKLDLLIVSHDQYFAAPAILGLAPIPTFFYCHEPTRALFESELAINPSWPILNRLYEYVYRLIKKWLEIANARNSTHIFTNSHYTKEYLHAVYNKESQVIYPCLDTNFFVPPKTINKSNSVVVVGNDEPQKRLLLALATIAKIPSSIRPTLHLVCPRSRPSTRLLSLAKRNGVKLKLHINITDQELCTLYQSAKVTLVTALREPFGLSIIESLACGTPVLAVDEGGPSEIIRDQETGYLCRPDPKNLAQKLKYLLTHKKLAQATGERGRLDMLVRFNCEQNTFNQALANFLLTR